MGRTWDRISASSSKVDAIRRWDHPGPGQSRHEKKNTVSPLPEPHPGRVVVTVERLGRGVESDWVAVEEPLEIRLDGAPLAVTLRTPGDDRDLVAGFLFTEGVIRGAGDLESIEPCPSPPRADRRLVHLGQGSSEPSGEDPNRIAVKLRPDIHRDPRAASRARREFRATAACGLCGKSSLEDIWQRLPPIEPLECDAALLRALPRRMRPSQALFEATGGIHAAALFDPQGQLLAIREDVGRHNAVDKLIGHFLLRGEVPLHRTILVASGRAGFEIVQKAMMASIPVLVSVGAASSLAVELASEGGLALYSFVGGRGGNRHPTAQSHAAVQPSDSF